ncbi:renin receptor-like [Branchiostoma floridae x Branchiostoma belcheri]
MAARWVISCLAVIIGLCRGEQLYVLHAPSYVQFLPSASPLCTVELPKVISLVLGFSTNKDLEWQGLGPGSLFQRPRANFLISVENLPNGATIEPVGGVKAAYPVKQTGLPDLEAVHSHIAASFPDRKSLMLDLSMDGNVFEMRSLYPGLFSQLPATPQQIAVHLQKDGSVLRTERLGSLNTTKEADLIFAGELQLLQDIMDTLTGNQALVSDGVPDLFSVSLTGVGRLAQEYGKNSQQVQDAITVLNNFLPKFSKSVAELYSGDVVVEALTLSTPTSGVQRPRRSLLQQGQDLPGNLAPHVKPDYPVIFNMSLWLGVLLLLAVYSVAYNLLYMEPGRDSIIYRMTSGRMKTEDDYTRFGQGAHRPVQKWD